VLDVAGGAGGQGLLAARRSGPSGAVLVTDLSAEIRTYAERVAAEQGLGHLSTRELDLLPGPGSSAGRDPGRLAPWRSVRGEQALARFEDGSGFEGPCELHVLSGER
jgi:hypothetical protein